MYFITAGDDPRFPFEGRSGLLVTGHQARPLEKAKKISGRGLTLDVIRKETPPEWIYTVWAGILIPTYEAKG